MLRRWITLGFAGCLLALCLGTSASAGSGTYFEITQAQAQRAAEQTAPKEAREGCIQGADCKLAPREVLPCSYHRSTGEYWCSVVEEFTTEGHCSLQLSQIRVARSQLVQKRYPPAEFQGWAKIKVKGKWRWVLTARISPWNLPRGIAGNPC